MIEYEKLYIEVKKSLSEKRFKHTEGVIKRAVEYAEAYNVNMEDVKYAALAHDIAKEMSNEESYEILNKYNVELDEIEKNNSNLLHSKVGAVIAKERYGLSNEIASAIEYHTTGKENMTILEKIIYLADATEEGRPFKRYGDEMELDDLVKLIKTDINEGLYYVLNWTLKSILNKEFLIHLNSVKAYNYYNNKKV